MDHHFTPNIVNVVTTTDLGISLDLQLISEVYFTSTLYEPESAHPPVPVYYKTPDMEGKISIFHTGKLISVGTKSPERSQIELENVVHMLFELHEKTPKKLEYIIQNLVATFDFQTRLNLERLYALIGGSYEPERFPAIILKENESSVTFLIFRSGKMNIVGAKTIDQLTFSLSNLVENILKMDIL